MVSDSIPSASVPMASSNPKDFAKKKRANRSAKLKQCKLDARREQWLSQVKNKERCKEDLSSGAGKHGGPSVDMDNDRHRMMEKMEINPRAGDESYGDGSSMHHYIDSGSSPLDSPTSHASSLLGSNHSGTNFTESSRSCSSRSSSSSSNGCDPEILSEEDDGNDIDDGCLDDWEAVADALAETDKKPELAPKSALGSLPCEDHGNSSSHLEMTNQVIEISNANPESGRMGIQRPSVNCRAWRVDDTLRPQCLPTLSKQYSFPLKSERHIGVGASVWGCKTFRPVPSSCPICFEELDYTDSSFLPCLCGFRLCLFCHKRILEEDGRCPGCRKQYSSGQVEGEAILDGGMGYQLTRSCSMLTRS
ncbi:mediator of RNA polymerase II transcription subunit 1-like [Dorcoceras hygrometricum]|nr:mediator of RNA polymerase II transcription subunit 1-like [Dorcoceras hygrometricum]